MELSPFYQELITSLNRGLVMSLALIVPSAIGGVCIGVFAGAVRVFGRPWMRRLGNGFAALFRGTPLVVQLFVLYFGLPNLGLYLPPYAAAVTGFILCSGAYQSEYVRGALLSIKNGQYHGAQALGFTNWQTIRSIILPQAFRRALPGCGNEIIYLIKYSSLAHVVSCIELTGNARSLAQTSFNYIGVFLTAGVYYLVLTTLAAWFLKYIENKLYVPGFGAPR